MLRCRAPFQSETALPEANSFPCGCQQFCCIPIGIFGVCRCVLRRVEQVVPPGVHGGQDFMLGVGGSVGPGQVSPTELASGPSYSRPKVGDTAATQEIC